MTVPHNNRHSLLSQAYVNKIGRPNLEGWNTKIANQIHTFLKENVLKYIDEGFKSRWHVDIFQLTLYQALL
jgi:hypothetical protein